MIISEALKAQRKVLKLTNVQIAERSGVPGHAIPEIMRGDRLPTAEQLQKLCGVLDLPVESFEGKRAHAERRIGRVSRP